MILNLFERLAYRFQSWYMSCRKTTEVTEHYRIRFHPHDCRDWVLKKYRKKLENLGITD